jgi:hypothetical protein
MAVFITDMTKAIVWPLATIVLAVMFRTPSKVLTEALRQIKYGGLEAQFARESLSIQKGLAKAAAIGDETKSDEKTPLELMSAAWHEVEQRIRAAAYATLGIQDGLIDTAVLLDRLVEKGVLRTTTQHAARSLQQLYHLAECAAPEKDMSQRVPEFITMAQAIGWNIEFDLARK